MSFVRPAARAALWRWREVLFGAVFLALSALWVATSFGLLRWLGWIALVFACIVILAGLQRARFRSSSGGKGVVQIIEGQVTYYGPLSGGAVAMSDLAALSLDGRSKPAHWLLVPEQGAALEIPISAEGADALFDVFSGLPGLKIEHLLRVKKSSARAHSVVWRRDDIQARINALH